MQLQQPQLLDIYREMSKTKAYRWAQVLGVITGLLLIWWCWSVAQFNLGWAAVLLVPLWISVTSTMEQLSKAWAIGRVAVYLQWTQSNPVLTMPQPEPEPTGWPEPPSDDNNNQGGTENEATEDWYEFEETEPIEAVELDESEMAVQDISNETKLNLCQFYSFLYVVVCLRKVGEKNLVAITGMPAAKYRSWIRAIAGPQLEIVAIQPGHTYLMLTDFDEALQRIADYKMQPAMWDYPKAVYSSNENWAEYVPSVEVNGQRVRLPGIANGENLLYPLYPTSLNELRVSVY